MIQATQRELKPRLRFPEFQDAGEWEVKRLDDFATIVRGGSPRPIDEYVTNDTNGLNWLKIGDIDKESKFVTSTQEKVIPAALTKTRVVNPGDLILSNSMSFGRPYILKIQTCIHDGWIAVSEINKSLDRDYLYYLMMTSDCQTYFSDNAAGSGVQNLNAEIIKLLPVSYPHKKEQQKIADCLSSIDELITAQTQKLVTLKTHKKGLMQQLFPAEGETLPKLRFPEFRDDWVIAKLGELGKLSGGGTPDKSVAEYWQGDIPWVSSSDVFEDDIYTMSVTRFINEKSISESATKIVPKGSVLFVSRVGTGKLAVNNIDVCTSQDFTNFLPKKIYNYFLGYFFIANKSALISLGQGTSIKGFSKGDLEQFEVSFPSSLEQKKIADCLSSIDELITAQTHKLATLKTHKKALMQQLFPAFDEVQR